jgi:hypothetical protein
MAKPITSAAAIFAPLSSPSAVRKRKVISSAAAETTTAMRIDAATMRRS